MFALLQILGDFLPILIVAAAVVAILASGYKKAPRIPPLSSPACGGAPLLARR